MLPPSWKSEIKETVEEAIAADRNQREAQQTEASTRIAAAINTLRDAQTAQTNSEDTNEKANQAINKVTLVLVAFTVLFTALSWSAFRDQLKEMKASAEQTNKIIEANTKLVEAANKQADSAAENARIAHDNFVASQRAWVGPITVTVNTIQKDKGIVGVIPYQNSGREPAANFFSGFLPKVYSLDEWNNGGATKDIMSYSSDCLKVTNLPNGLQVVYPSSGFSSYQTSFDTERMAEPNKIIVTDDLISGKSIFALRGCFTYKSIKEFHHSAFCFYYLASFSTLPNLSICNVGNDAD